MNKILFSERRRRPYFWQMIKATHSVSFLGFFSPPVSASQPAILPVTRLAEQAPTVYETCTHASDSPPLLSCAVVPVFLGRKARKAGLLVLLASIVCSWNLRQKQAGGLTRNCQSAPKPETDVKFLLQVAGRRGTQEQGKPRGESDGSRKKA